MRSHRKLRVWCLAMDLTVEVYGVCRALPAEERYGLQSQLRRAAVSVPANIAEGHARDHLGDYLRHISIAKGSLAEVETLLTLTKRLELLEEIEIEAVCGECRRLARMLERLSAALRRVKRA